MSIGKTRKSTPHVSESCCPNRPSSRCGGNCASGLYPHSNCSPCGEWHRAVYLCRVPHSLTKLFSSHSRMSDTMAPLSSTPQPCAPGSSVNLHSLQQVLHRFEDGGEEFSELILPRLRSAASEVRMSSKKNFARGRNSGIAVDL
jgi:hypothetical protein